MMLASLRNQLRNSTVRTLVMITLTCPVAWTQSRPAPLTADQVVQHLMERNQERAAALQHYVGRRTYRLEYRGFPGTTEASMEVEVNFDAPSSKHFTVLSSSGNKAIQNRVFRKLLEGEEQAGAPGQGRNNELSAQNYAFTLSGCDESSYILNVEPKEESKFLYRGQIWVDAHDFAVTRIEAQPAKNPSFWTTRSLIHHTYQKLDNGLYLPKENKTVTSVRLGGTATLTIEYQSYRITTAKPVALERKAIPAKAFAWPDGALGEPVEQLVSVRK
jgi:hypothetical protein